MEFLDLLHPVTSPSSSPFLPSSSSSCGHGHAQQLTKKTVILLPFCVARPAAWFVCAESKSREKTIISQRRWFDLLLAAMPEKIMDKVLDVGITFRKIFLMTCWRPVFWRPTPCLTTRRWTCSSSPSLCVARSSPTDVGQHAGLLSLWHGKDHHVPSDFLGRKGRVRFSIVMHLWWHRTHVWGGGMHSQASQDHRSHVIETGSAGAHSWACNASRKLCLA